MFTDYYHRPSIRTTTLTNDVLQNIEITQKVQLKDIDIEQSNLTHEQIAKVKDLLDKNSDIFCKNDLMPLQFSEVDKRHVLSFCSIVCNLHIV
jgi:hypothetical protein